MKKSTKVILAALSLTAAGVTTTATAAPAFAADDTTNDVMVISTQDQKQSISLSMTKAGTTTPSEAAQFFGNSATVTTKDGKVDGLSIHVDGSKSPMTKGQDVSKMIESVTLNGAEGTKENVADDGSSFDLVFPASAYKEGKGTIEFTLNVMGQTMSEKADVTLGKLSTDESKDSQTENKDNQTTDTTDKTDEEKTDTDTTNPKSSKKVVMANAYVYNKSGKRVGKKTIKLGATVKVLGAKTIKGKRYYQIGKNSFIRTVNIDGTKRTLKKNAYTYTKAGKHASKKLLKKNTEVATYGKVIKLHGKEFYRVSKDTYVRKANF
ncbi:SLAP domain-containing protein [Lactobacillus intestinalis]|uniref:SLAP domain-containing protein n=1 Tax=Lactobacillus intestinalis TaxID=151781 RepID=UPI00242BEAC6|nr:SLAP domain-containing protein [Lactobacillus intestinalis]